MKVLSMRAVTKLPIIIIITISLLYNPTMAASASHYDLNSLPEKEPTKEKCQVVLSLLQQVLGEALPGGLQ